MNYVVKRLGLSLQQSILPKFNGVEGGIYTFLDLNRKTIFKRYSSQRGHHQKKKK